jgi:hypothetical protein
MWDSERIYHKVGGDVCAGIGACFDVPPWPDASRGPGHSRVPVVVLSSLATFDKTLKPQTRMLIEEIVRDAEALKDLFRAMDLELPFRAITHVKGNK